MSKQNEIVPIQFVEDKKLEEKKKAPTAKIAFRLKHQDGHEVMIYNGIQQYILKALLQELMTDASWILQKSLRSMPRGRSAISIFPRALMALPA